MTQITRKSVPVRGLILLLAMFLSAGLVLTGCGDDDTATTPAPAPPPPPPPEPEPEPEPEPQAPATPTGLHVDETTQTSIEWHWNAVEGANAYVVQISLNEMFGDEDDRADITLEPHYKVTDLEPNTSVYLRVAAAIGTSLEDALVSAFTTHVTGVSAMPPPPPPAPEPPGMPTGLMVSETTQTSITWTWNAVEGATGYMVQVSDDEMFDDTDESHATEETSYTASDLEPDTTVYVRVAATSEAGTGAFTTHVTGMSAMVPPPPPLETPAAPTGLTGVGTTDTAIMWSWDAVMGADGYQVQVNSDDDFAGVDAMNVAETSYTQTGLTAGATSYLRVRATVGSGDRMAMSEWTAQKSATTRTPPVMPMNLAATAGDGSITWTWDAADHADSYDVQHSADGAFLPDMDSENVAETSFTVSDLAPGTAGYLRVRASGGTGDQVRLTSGWTAPTRGMSAQIAIPPAPTGLNATGGDGSITWGWNAVDGATGYQVQVSETEDFGDAETVDLDADTTSYSVDVDAGATRYLRVRATGMGDPSAWSTHVTGMSDPPVAPPPPAMDPIEVSFSVGEDDGYPMTPDDGTDKEKAMASVNSKMVVSSNYAAEITPMWIDGANPVTVSMGDNEMPFTYVSWNALQSAVVGDGVKFMVQRLDSADDDGAVAYVACGPFECVTGGADVTAPMVTIADDKSCQMWQDGVDSMLDVTWGWVDNDVYSASGGTTGTTVTDDGIELGWTTSSTLGMTVEHIFNGVPQGRNFTAKGPDAKGDKNAKVTSLKMTRDDDANTTADEAISLDPTNEDYKYGTSALPALTDRVGECIAAGGTENDISSPYSYTTTGQTFGTQGTAGLLQPDDCFKVDAKPDWLSGYSLKFTPKNDGVKWAKGINWFSDLTCESYERAASDFTSDICDLFDAEVERAMDAKWTRVTFDNRGTDDVGGGGENSHGNNFYITEWRIGPVLDDSDTAEDEGLEARQFKTLWFDDDLDGDLKVKGSDKNPTAFARQGANDLYGVLGPGTDDGRTRTDDNVNYIWQGRSTPTTIRRATSARLTW